MAEIGRHLGFDAYWAKPSLHRQPGTTPTRAKGRILALTGVFGFNSAWFAGRAPGRITLGNCVDANLPCDYLSMRILYECV